MSIPSASSPSSARARWAPASPRCSHAPAPTVRLYDICAEAHRSAPRPPTGIVCRRARGQVEAQSATAAAIVAFRADLEAALTGTEFDRRGSPREARAQEGRARRRRGDVSADDVIIATNTSGIPITTMAERHDEPRAVHRHALVQPAAPHPDDRGHQGGARPTTRSSGPPRRDHEGVQLRARRSRRRPPASSRTACSTRSSASASPCSTRASSRRRISTRASSGASATSCRSWARRDCSTWRGSTSTKTCRAISTRSSTIGAVYPHVHHKT